ncbi:ATP synthase subunit gamma, mitochondrial [Caerostris extrusa]|uniref:ATP synthase subunit gamma, mitochondrial n=1 Tax=Caerostris extrusa TaxID=172846 RepID=A0AAV4QFE7_CAEEX|nr:ATP synthase subunit gamma, mitochondrial [Caerostris extrusa]
MFTTVAKVTFSTPLCTQFRGMATLKDIRMRLKSVKNIQKITQSMKMVSAAKYARAERDLKKARPFGEGASSFYESAEVKGDPNKPGTMIIAVTSDRGLCGAVHSSVSKRIRAMLGEAADNSHHLSNKTTESTLSAFPSDLFGSYRSPITYEIRFRVYRRVRLAQIKRNRVSVTAGRGFDQSSPQCFVVALQGERALLPTVRGGNNLALNFAEIVCRRYRDVRWTALVFGECWEPSTRITNNGGVLPPRIGLATEISCPPFALVNFGLQLFVCMHGYDDELRNVHEG